MKFNQKTSASSIVFYVISVILLCVFAFQVYYSYDYISGYDLDFSAEWKAVFSIYFGQCVLPFFGAVATYGIGLILAKLSSLEVSTVATETKVIVEEEAMEDLVSSLKEVKAETKASNADTKKETAKTDTKEDVKTEAKEEKNTKPAAKKPAAKKAVKAKKDEAVDGKEVDNKETEKEVEKEAIKG